MSEFTPYERHLAQTHVLNMEQLSAETKRQMLDWGVVYAADTTAFAHVHVGKMTEQASQELLAFWDGVDLSDPKWQVVRESTRIFKQPEIIHGKALPEAMQPSMKDVEASRSALMKNLGEETLETVDYNRLAVLYDIREGDSFAQRIVPFMWQAERGYETLVRGTNADDQLSMATLAMRFSGQKLTDKFGASADQMSVAVQVFKDFASEISNRVETVDADTANRIDYKIGLV